MSKLTLEAIDSRGGGTFVPDSFFGDFIARFQGVYNPAELDTDPDEDTHFRSICNLLYSVGELLGNSFGYYIGADDSDADTEFSVFGPDAITFGGVEFTWTNQVNVTGLVADATLYIWLDFSDPPNITVETGSDWPDPTGPYWRLGTIEQPHTGPWRSQHLTRAGFMSAASGAGGGGGAKEVAIAHADATTTIDTLAAGQRVLRVTVDITTAYNGNALLTIGDDSSNARFATIPIAVLGTISQVTYAVFYKYGASTPVKAYFTANGATVGASAVILETT